uniref:Uncharacterized protein n=1 Tax=Megaviridae environmental sample TaxID=1737588 RepID=A0A5J6VJJ7_9VIRU|nr:MAG: hypothetical protein [Megaviridae environmental sample]
MVNKRISINEAYNIYKKTDIFHSKSLLQLNGGTIADKSHDIHPNI